MGDFKQMREKRGLKRKRKEKKRQESADESGRNNPELIWKIAIENAPLDDTSHESWSSVICMSKETLMQYLHLIYPSTEDQKDFWTAYDQAKIDWECSDCKSFDPKNKEMILCKICNQWKHLKCMKNVVEEENLYQCKKCKAFLIADGRADHNYGSEESSDSD